MSRNFYDELTGAEQEKLDSGFDSLCLHIGLNQENSEVWPALNALAEWIIASRPEKAVAPPVAYVVIEREPNSIGVERVSPCGIFATEAQAFDAFMAYAALLHQSSGTCPTYVRTKRITTD